MSAVLSTLSNLAKRGLTLVYPEICQLCHDEPAKPEDGFVGVECLAEMKPIEAPFCRRCGQPFEGAITVGFECTNCREMALNFEFARGVMRGSTRMLDAIHKFKYQQALWLEPLFRRQLAMVAVEQIRSWRGDCLVPVPLHPVRFRERGFNQAETLCRCLNQEIDLSVMTRAVRRVRVTRTQALLSRRERLANMRGAFAPGQQSLNGRRVVLVDDVLTTGATTSECAGACKRAGASAVCVWTLARGLVSPSN